MRALHRSPTLPPTALLLHLSPPPPRHTTTPTSTHRREGLVALGVEEHRGAAQPVVFRAHVGRQAHFREHGGGVVEKMVRKANLVGAQRELAGGAAAYMWTSTTTTKNGA